MSRFRTVRSGATILILLAPGCAPDASPLHPSDGAELAVDESAPRLTSVSPSVAHYADETRVTLSGTGFGAQVVRITLTQSDGHATDPVAAAGIQRVSGSEITATFPAVASQQVGRKTVTIEFGNGKRATLPAGFLYRYEQDPVVFVHGCPLPPGFGSVTNYITSKYWHPLYNDLRTAGYPAPSWARRDTFDVYFDHPATRPASNNYLNVFVLSEDSRAPQHTEDHTDPQRGGHCGSGFKLAEELDAFVAQVLARTGAERVDLVVNSGSALGARWFLRHYEGSARVRDAAFLAGMNHGTEVAIVPSADSVTGTWASPNYDMAREGFPAYACRDDPALLSAADHTFEDRHGHTYRGHQLQELVNGCVARRALEPFDELAPGVSFLSIYNVAVDELIEPTHSACLGQSFPGDCTSPVNVPVHAVDPSNPRDTPHGAIRADPEVRALTVCHLRLRSHAHASTRDCEAERLAAMTS